MSDRRYEEIKLDDVDMYYECELNTYPINCVVIANKLGYDLYPYSTLPEKSRDAAMDYYLKWLSYCPQYTENEIRLLEIFGVAA